MPDFGIFRGFNDKLFGDKLYAGQLPTQLGLIGSTDFSGTDPDAQAFFDRVEFATGVLSATEKTAIDTLVKQMKFDGIWNSMKAIYPMVGASAAACAQNLKSSSFTGTFTATGWTFASSGVTPNGTSAYMDTGLNENTQMSLTSCNIGIYTSTNFQTALKYDMGVYQSNITSILFYVNEVFFRNMNFEGGQPAPVNISGFWQNNRTSNNVKKIFFNNTIRNTSSALSLSKANLNYFISALNNSGTPAGYGLNTISFAFVSDGLTDTQASNFYIAVQAFQTTLSREV